MGRLADFATLVDAAGAPGVARAPISGPDARNMAAEFLRIEPGATLRDAVPAGSDRYLYALTGSARIDGARTWILAQDAFATLQEGTAFTLSNPGAAALDVVSVLAPPPGSARALAGFDGGVAVIARTGAPAADVPDQKKRRLYFVDPVATRSERAHAMIVEYQADTHTVMHQHPNADSLFVPLTGKVLFTFDGRDHVVGRGQAAAFPAGNLHGLRVAEGAVSFLEFHVPAAYVTVK